MSTVKPNPRKPRTEPYRLFTTTFPVAILRELDNASKETGLRKNKILIQAFTAWNAERKKAC
jgi:hypothetical protein